MQQSKIDVTTKKAINHPGSPEYGSVANIGDSEGKELVRANQAVAGCRLRFVPDLLFFSFMRMPDMDMADVGMSRGRPFGLGLPLTTGLPLNVGLPLCLDLLMFLGFVGWVGLPLCMGLGLPLRVGLPLNIGLPLRLDLLLFLGFVE